jgi:hypothetical protein
MSTPNYVAPDFHQMARMALGLSLSGQVDGARDRFLESRLEQVAKAMKLAHEMGRDNMMRRMRMILEIPGIDDPTANIGILPSAE